MQSSKNQTSQLKHTNRLIWLMVRRELKVKYRGTFLGYLWSMMNPMLFMLVISFVFSHVIRGIENYNLYVLSGLLLWSACSVSLHIGTQSIVNSAYMLRKIKIPMWIFPVIPSVTAVVNLLLSLIPYAGFYLYSGRPFPPDLYLAPLVIVLAMVFTVGIALILSSLNVFFRDVQHVLEPVLTLVFYATPVIYDRHMDQIPANIQFYLGLNPITQIIETFRATVFGGPRVSLEQILTVVAIAAASVTVGIIVHSALRKKIQFHI